MMGNFAARQIIEYLRPVFPVAWRAIFSYAGRLPASAWSVNCSGCDRRRRPFPVIMGNFWQRQDAFLNIIAHKAEEMNFAVVLCRSPKKLPLIKWTACTAGRRPDYACRVVPNPASSLCWKHCRRTVSRLKSC